MIELRDLLLLLHDGDSRWETVEATVREWKDQRLVTQAFMAEGHARETSVIAVGSHSPDHRDVSESTYRLWTDGERTRVEREPTSEARPELLVRLGNVWWTYRRDWGSVTNAGATNFGTGGDEVVAQLRPSAYLSRFHWSVVRQDDVADRPCVIAHAEARPHSASFHEPPAFDMISGGTEFEVAADLDKGVLLRVVKLVDDAPAEIREFVSVKFDVRFDDDLFVFRSPDGSPIQSSDEYRRRIMDR